MFKDIDPCPEALPSEKKTKTLPQRERGRGRCLLRSVGCLLVVVLLSSLQWCDTCSNLPMGLTRLRTELDVRIDQHVVPFGLLPPAGGNKARAWYFQKIHFRDFHKIIFFSRKNHDFSENHDFRKFRKIWKSAIFENPKVFWENFRKIFEFYFDIFINYMYKRVSVPNTMALRHR